MKSADQLYKEQLQSEYSVDESGRITNAGKFEREPLWAPYFWGAALDGMADDDDGHYFRFDLTDDDKALWPELAGHKLVKLIEDSNGFVSTIKMPE